MATCACGCGGSVREGRTWLKGHVNKVQMVRGGLRREEYKIEDCGYETPCWTWQRGKCNGYGVVRIHGVVRGAHRVMYEQEVGPLPDDSNSSVDHLCRNRACINPAHME